MDEDGGAVMGALNEKMQAIIYIIKMECFGISAFLSRRCFTEFLWPNPRV